MLQSNVLAIAVLALFFAASAPLSAQNLDDLPREILDPNLPNPDYDARPDRSPDITGLCSDREPGEFNTSEARYQMAREKAYFEYALICLARMIQGLPCPSIEHEDYGESKWSVPPSDLIVIIGAYSIWLDDPLNAVDDPN